MEMILLGFSGVLYHKCEQMSTGFGWGLTNFHRCAIVWCVKILQQFFPKCRGSVFRGIFQRGEVNKIHKMEVPEHPVIAQMERWGFLRGIPSPGEKVARREP